MKKFATALFALVVLAGLGQAYACDETRLPDCTVYGDGHMVCEEQ